MFSPGLMEHCGRNGRAVFNNYAIRRKRQDRFGQKRLAVLAVGLRLGDQLLSNFGVLFEIGANMPQHVPSPGAESSRTDEPALEERFRREGSIPIRVGNGANDPIRWIKQGGGEVFKDLDVGPEMVTAPAGSFTMGSNRDERLKPPHTVTISKPFAVGRFPVTFDEWDAVGLNYTPSDEGWGRRDVDKILVGRFHHA